MLLKREVALISVFGGILENKDCDRQKEFEKLAKACFFYGIKEIFQKAEAEFTFTPYYITRAINEAVIVWRKNNSLLQFKWEGLEQQYSYFIHLLIDDARIFAIGKLGFRYYRSITKSWYGILDSKKKAVQDRRLKLFKYKESKAVISGVKDFSFPYYRDEL